MIKRFVIAFVLLAILVGGLIGFNLFRDKAIQDFFANMQRPAVTVSTVTVEPLSWKPDVQAIGTVNAVRGVDLTVETSGIVDTILFEANDTVEQGAMLMQLKAEVERADLDAARAQAALDQQLLNRALQLRERGVSSETTVDSQQAAATASTSQVAKLEAVLDQKQLIAPFGGTIGIPHIEKGQYLSPGTTVATLQDTETMRADFTVPEQELPLIEIGQPVRIGLSADNMPFEGRITGIEPKIDPQTRLVAVRAEISNPEGKLTPGQFAQVAVMLPQEDNVVALPQTAVVTSLYGDYVYAVVEAEVEGGATPAAAGEGDGQSDEAQASDDAQAQDEEAGPALVARQIFVKTGRRSGGLVEIVEGVAAGEQIVTAGQNRLNNGSPVNIDNSVNPSASLTQQAAAQ
ncbi:efflux RND transporter periplasmic adaptor subunit [Mesorhizobium xinjiangense]|uniref:efflux RND transporter periplasmic adaptor subunit n=1 Tax=Mesorhizobium xinjiangense TaxID=2678685 RepID=UPI0012EDA4DA|nr:efflux RND transporter periplasmic adaptor subunit [Mesorhizobium xinjiangense]